MDATKFVGILRAAQTLLDDPEVQALLREHPAKPQRQFVKVIRLTKDAVAGDILEVVHTIQIPVKPGEAPQFRVEARDYRRAFARGDGTLIILTTLEPGEYEVL